jgi:hypothetical protein
MLMYLKAKKVINNFQKKKKVTHVVIHLTTATRLLLSQNGLAS